MMYQNNILPIGESGMHIPTDDCPCKPKLFEEGVEYVLMHVSFDHREAWLEAEQIIGITCQEHMQFVDRATYAPGVPHSHVGKPEPYFEYEHEKIDPR